ncbi:MAG: hypothetical protein ACJAXK_000494 [Yoonia sp.]|jgi:hypothetical protein
MSKKLALKFCNAKAMVWAAQLPTPSPQQIVGAQTGASTSDTMGKFSPNLHF